MTLDRGLIYNMETYTQLYSKIYSMANLTLAWRKARKGKTTKLDVISFDKSVTKNLLNLHNELKNKTYEPRSLRTFILRDPKTRKISKSDFRDRVIHHAVVNIISPILEKSFIYDSCAGRKRKGTLFALKRFEKFVRKVSGNCRNRSNRFRDRNFIKGYCFKADIKHYFREVNHQVLINIISRKINDEDVLGLIRKILNNVPSSRQRGGGVNAFLIIKGMPLGNLTSQFFANVYLNELDYFVKHVLKVKCYLRYVDDFVILHNSNKQLKKWKIEIEKFLIEKLKLELHPDKSRIIPLCEGVDFVGFRNFAYFRLLRKRNIKKMNRKIELFNQDKIGFRSLGESYQGWQAYARWANTHELRKEIKGKIIDIIWNKI